MPPKRKSVLPKSGDVKENGVPTKKAKSKSNCNQIQLVIVK